MKTISNTFEQEYEVVTAARRGDQAAFEKLVEPYQHELIVHCYRFLGSYEDAEDLFQETLLRAWRRLDSFEGRSTFRAWLYKIATNACLDALDSRKRRAQSVDLYPQGDPQQPLPTPVQEISWVEPFPETLIDHQLNIYPEARYETRESITLAFVAALQNLPGRQRAVLLLRDVLGWSTDEVTQILEMTSTAVNSALQRARATMQQHWQRQPAPLTDALLSSLLARYVAAWEQADTNALVALLREDVALTMPPIPVWFRGHADIRQFLDGFLFNRLNAFRFHLLPAPASGSTAFGVYQMDAGGIYRPAALHILTIRAGQISQIDDFLNFDERLFSKFGLPVSG
jgi:RNA polymerase sigma-70 factor, ECF subfamily